MASPNTKTVAEDVTPRRIRLWRHGRAMRQMLRAYPPGTDAMIDQMRAAFPPLRFLFFRVLGPLYFAREEGWMIPGERGVMAAMIYLRRDARLGIRALHIDDINVDADYRRRGFAQRLMNLAEERALAERRPFLKLAVTVANTPAVTLYRRLGYREQHHRYFTYGPASAPLPSAPSSAELTFSPLRRRAAAEVMRQSARAELQAGVPEVADLMAVYYTPRLSRGRRYAVQRGVDQVGYAQASGRGGRWNLYLALRPELWGTATERWVIETLASRLGERSSAPVALHVPSAAHFDALRASPVADELGLVEQTHDRMIMVKPLASS